MSTPDEIARVLAEAQPVLDRIIHREGEWGKSYAATLPELLARFAAEHPSLCNYQMLSGGMNGLCLAADTASIGCDVVVKLFAPWTDIDSEIDFLRRGQGSVCPSLLEEELDRGYFVLDRIRPGSDGLVRGTAAAHFAEVADLSSRLALLPTDGLPSLHLRTSKRLTNARRVGIVDVVPAEYTNRLDEAEAIAEHLLSTAGESVLCHGDFWRTNILRDHDDRLLCIDAAAAVGERAADLAFYLLPWQEDLDGLLPASAAERLQLLAEAAAIDEHRLLGWMRFYLLCSLSTRRAIDPPDLWQLRLRWVEETDALAAC